MAPNLAVKSESWLDLSTRSELIEACKLQQNTRRHFERGVSIEPSCLDASSQARRHSSPLALSSASSATSSHNQHLLIRLRQHAYLARSNSTTLSSSSNLSASIDLEPAALDARPKQCDDHNQDARAQPRRRERPREFSFGLRSFRARFEQRQSRAASHSSTAAGRRRRQSPAAAATAGSNDQQRPIGERPTRDASPFARSWSSLSHHLESHLSHLGQSCKSFLYKYQRRQTPDDEHAGNRLKRSQEWQQQLPTADNHPSLFSVKRRLTSDWVARHCAATREGASDPRREHLAATRAIDRGRAASERPERRIQLENDARARPTIEIGFHQQQQQQQQRASSEFCQRAPASAPRSSESRTSSSITLVSESERIRCDRKSKRVTRRSKKGTRRREDNNQQVDHETNSSSGTTASASTMSSGGQQNQQGRRHCVDRITQQQQQQLILPPPAATSDYWSGGATTATASEFELLAASGGQISGSGERLVGVAPGPDPLDTAQDQDYYLDVANSLLPGQVMTFHQQQTPVSQTINQQQQQQQHQELLMHRLQQEQVMLAAAELEADYDDYAVPSDESNCRLDRSQVELVRLIGEGQKGFVFLGKLQSRDGSTIIDVAIKTLKYETDQLIERLMAEAATMKQLEHPHIIKFIGMCPETPALIAMELAQFGELKHYLKINRQLIKCSQLVLFTFQISTALSYLESKNYVHRDVAARNVLVCSHNCVKLADFGLSRNLQTLHAPAPAPAQQQQQAAAPLVGSGNLLLAPHDQNHAASADQSLYVAAPRGKLPVRWLAPESLVFRRFTSASDVWMFAVCAWELFHFGQLRPWPQLRNQQVLLAIESGQRPQRPPACPERLYALMLKCWSYAPVQRPKFREIKQCIWSIYLNERTREQQDIERLEQVRQRYLMMARQQQQQQQVAMMQHHSNQQQLLMSYSTPSNYSSAATTDNEQSTSPCSSAFNSMGRGSSAMAAHQQQQQQQQQLLKRPVQVQRPDAAHHNNQQALQSQLSRFKQRQQQAPPADFRPHVLQKQRSQGAIGLTMQQQDRDQSCCRHSAMVGPKDKRRVTRTRDDQAIKLAKRTQQPHRPAFFGFNDDDADDDDDNDERGEDDEDSAVDSPTMLTSQSQGRNMRQLAQPLGPCGGRVMSASPALTADLNARSQSRMVSLEPAYEGLFALSHQQAGSSGASHAPHLSSRPASRAGAREPAMLRANLDLGGGGGSSRTSPSLLTNVTTSPALTTSHSNPPTRPVSWSRNSSELHASAASNSQQQQQQQQRPAASKCKQQADQLGQMLQALRITPMKAKLKQPPEQSVRVLQRESSKSPSQPRRSETSQARQQRTRSDNDQSDQPDQVDEHARQLMVHQRLLGRIRPSSIVSEPRARTPKGRLESAPSQETQPSATTTRQLIHQKSVEAVDHSLQILESLMSSEGGLRDRTTTSTLPRKRSAR